METRASKRQKVTGQSNVTSNPPKTARSRPRATTKGILKHMPDMPLDILIEIFGYMAPQDLLNLSRSLKSFRGVLTSRTSRPFWRNAFKNIQEEVPEMPPMLNELQWANLLFSDHCHECCKAGVEFIEWAFWIRYCDECREKLIVSWRIHQSLLEFLPSTAPASLPFKPNLRLISFTSYSKEVINIKQVNSLRREWDALDPTDRKKFTAERVAQIDESREHSDRCARFEAKKRQEMQLQQEAIRRERINSVKRKFSELGFGPVMDRFSKSIDSTFRSGQQVNQSKVLTDDEWPKIRNQYLKMFNKFKKEHLVLQRLENTEKRLSMVRRILEKLKETERILSPHPRDFCQLPEIRRIVDGPKDDLMPLKISEDDFLNAHRSQIDQAIANWKKSSKESLKALAQEAAPYVLQSVDPMNLAVGIFFTCEICANTPVMTFPSLLHHGCVEVRWKIPSKSKDPYHCALRKVFYGCGSHFNYTTLNIKSSIHSLASTAKLIIETCGEDPSRVTPEEMDKSTARVVCLACTRTGFRPVMTWRTAVLHFSEKCVSKVPKIHRATEFDLEKTADLDASMLPGSYACARCNKWNKQFPTTQSTIYDHLRDEHGMQQHPCEGRDYTVYQEIDRCLTAKYPVWLISKKVAPATFRTTWRCKYQYHVVCDFLEDGDSSGAWPKIKMI